MKKLGKPAKHSRASLDDIAAISTLGSILSKVGLVKPALNSEDSRPNHDGYLEILDSNGYEKGKMFAQVKKMNKKNKTTKRIYRFKNNKFLSYCSVTHENPILLIVVDIESNIAYWEEMTPQYVQHLKGKTVYFSNDKIISETDNNYHKNWLEICTERIKRFQEIQNSRKLPRIKIRKRKPVIPATMVRAKERIKNLFIDQELKSKYYYALIDLLGPFYLDRRGNNLRELLQKLFDITENEERKIIDKMVSENQVNIVGGICFVKDQEKAKDIQNEMLTRGAVDLKTLLNFIA